MGTGGSSSKRKSSSLNNKRSKNPPEVRRKKKNSGRCRTKKLHRQVDSVSNSDSDDSRSSVSYSSSSSEDDYRRRRRSSRRRPRPRTRRIVKGGKKRAETSSSSPESSGELPHSRKIKGSKKAVGSYTLKKTYKRKPRRDMSVSSTSSVSSSDKTRKKKPRGGMSATSASSDSMSSETYKKKLRRDMRVSSASSDSLSYSSCSESEYKRPQRRSKTKDRDKGNGGKLKSDISSRYRSRGSCSKHSNTSGYHSEERMMVKTNSRRLRSVITSVKDPDEKDGSQLDRGDEEKFIFDHNDYPCKGYDSVEGGKKREHANHLPVESEKRRKVENNRDVGKSNLARKNKCDEDCAAAGSLNSEDLESILRQKALENMRKFRGMSQKDMKFPAQEKDMIDNDVRQLPQTNTELVGSKMPKKVAGNTAIGTNSVVKEATTHKTISPADYVVVSCKPKESMNASASVIAKTGVNSTSASQNVNKHWLRHNEVKSMTPKLDTVSPAETVHVSGSPIEKNLSADVITRNHVFSSNPKESMKAPTSVIAKTGIDSSHASKNVSKLMVKHNEVKSLIPKKHTLSPVDTVTVSGNPKENNFTTGVIVKTVADSICSPQTKRKIPVKGHVIQSGIPKENLISTASAGTDKLESGTPSTSHTSPKAHSVAKSSMDKSLGTNNQGAEVNNTCDSFAPNPVPSLKPTGKESNVKEISDETKEASQFEHKTMSAMRGGERVQVSYKVYIPKKAPALARRQLKR